MTIKYISRKTGTRVALCEHWRNRTSAHAGEDRGRQSEAMSGGARFVARVSAFAAGLVALTPSVATVAIIDHTSERIIIAADSRTVTKSSVGSISLSDADCKVVPLGNSAVFLLVGYARYGTDGPDESAPWQARGLAQRLFHEAVKESGGWNDGMLEGLALSWRNSTMAHMGTLLRANLKRFTEELGGLNAQGVFATGAGNSVRALYVEVALTKTGKVMAVGPSPLNCIGRPCVYGANRIADEFLDLTSQRAKDDAERWQSETNGLSETERAPSSVSSC